MRRLAALLALILVVATGMAHSVSYLCLMDGQVRPSCCCNGHETEGSDDPSVEKDSNCCEVRFSEASPMPATTKDGQQQHQLAVSLALAPPPAIDVPRRAGRDMAPAMGARASPSGVGRPLFVLNCSYLI